MRNLDFGYGFCRFPGCGKFAKTMKHRLCGGHDSQMRKGYQLTEIKSQGVSDIGIEGWRRCTSCDEVKKVDDFYLRVTGKPHSHCKDCMIRDNAAYSKAKKASQEAHSGV